jgi:hypothetical protein
MNGGESLSWYSLLLTSRSGEHPGGADIDDQNVVVAGDVRDIGVEETVRA